MITLPSGRKIGEGEPPFIIAEVGSNWATLDDCLTSISLARNCGADAVKFQLFTHESLYGLPREGWHIGTMEKIQGGQNHSGWDCNPPFLNPVWLPLLKERADKVGIEFMCSAFSPELIEAVNPFVNIHKVASAECTHKRMLEKLRTLEKPVILSTGAHGIMDIRASVALMSQHPEFDHLGYYSMKDQPPGEKQWFDYFPVPVVLLYCVAAYPANEVNLDCIAALSTTFGLPIGYSDHTVDIRVIPKAACESGAVVLEKHFTAIPETATLDRPHSLDPSQFRLMVDSLRGKTSPILGANPSEKEMVLRHNRRLIATRDIAEGEEFAEGENFGIYRSLKGDMHAFHPFMIDEVNGKEAKRAIQAGDGIGPGDV